MPASLYAGTSRGSFSAVLVSLGDLTLLAWGHRPLRVVGRQTTLTWDPGLSALRFTLSTGTSPGQDINLSLERVNANRNFTNKIWNVGKFIEFSLKDVSDQEYQALAKSASTIPDRLDQVMRSEGHKRHGAPCCRLLCSLCQRCHP